MEHRRPPPKLTSNPAQLRPHVGPHPPAGAPPAARRPARGRLRPLRSGVVCCKTPNPFCCAPIFDFDSQSDTLVTLIRAFAKCAPFHCRLSMSSTEYDECSTPTAWGLWCRPLPAQRSGQRCAALCLLRRGRGSVVDIKGCVALKSVCSVSLGCAVIGAYPGGGRGSHPPVGVRAGCASWGGRLQVVAPGRARAVHRGKRVRRARRERRRAQPRR
jgi:hypothetical protein